MRKSIILLLLSSMLLYGCGKTQVNEYKAEDPDYLERTNGGFGYIPGSETDASTNGESTGGWGKWEPEENIANEPVVETVYNLYWDETVEYKTYDTKGSMNYDFTLKNTDYTWPLTISDIMDGGWYINGPSLEREYTIDDWDRYEVEAHSTKSMIVFNGDENVHLLLVNKTDEKQDIFDCDVIGIMVGDGCFYTNEHIKFESPDGFTYGDSEKKVTKAIGSDSVQGTCRIKLGDTDDITYCERVEYSSTSSSEEPIGVIRYMFVKGKLSGIHILYKGV